LLVHQKEYVERFFNHQLSEKEIRRIGLKTLEESYSRKNPSIDGWSFAGNGASVDSRT
jgi:hypothetical protein